MLNQSSFCCALSAYIGGYIALYKYATSSAKSQNTYAAISLFANSNNKLSHLNLLAVTTLQYIIIFLSLARVLFYTSFDDSFYTFVLTLTAPDQLVIIVYLKS